MSDTEERNLPPSDTKLRRARRDGRIAHSRDVIALAILPLIVALILNWGSYQSQLQDLFRITFTRDFVMGREEVVGRFAPHLLEMAAWIALPPLMIAAGCGLLLSIIDNGGVVFSGKPIAPDFRRINPAEGFKRLFSIRVAAESGFALVKLALFTGVTIAVITRALDTVSHVQVCGLPCVPQVFDSIIFPLLIAFAGLYLFFAVIDFILSRALFRQEMRMSHSELKRENKDVYGNPEIRRRRKSESQSMMTGPRRLGILESTLVIMSNDELIGLRYMPSEESAPIVVAKARGLAVIEMRRAAELADIPITENLRLARILSRRGFLGRVIPTDTFTEVAAEIIRQNG